MNTQHTPGPWIVGRSDSHLHITTRDDGHGPTVATLVRSQPGHPMSRQHHTENAEANARLIAAAPELLAALQELVTRCDGAEGVRADGSNIQTMRAHAAIIKALDRPRDHASR